MLELIFTVQIGAKTALGLGYTTLKLRRTVALKRKNKRKLFRQ